MGTTPNHQLPYPELPDPANVPLDMRELAEAVDAAIPTTGVIPPTGATINVPVLDVGVAGQYRAGRQLAVADFTALGLSVPIGLWNLGSLADSSGNARNLTDKGSVPYGAGINGAATTAAVFAGSTGQALFINDGGVADPFRIKTGSVGCWVRTAKRATNQDVFAKWSGTTGQAGWMLRLAAAGVQFLASLDGTAVSTAAGITDVLDDRWHHIVATYDGAALCVYVDGALEGLTLISGVLFGSIGPLTIGASLADATTAGLNPHYGRVDEAFVTADVLTGDQVRCLYAAKLLHGLAGTPTQMTCNVRRLRRGAPLVVADFPAQPLRLYNFTGGDLIGLGTDTSANRTLVNNGNAPVVAGADGAAAAGFAFNGTQSLSATDAGLPAGTAARSYGCWCKAIGIPSTVFMGWGTQATGDVRLLMINGALTSANAADTITGPFVGDGQWHHVVATEDNAAGDGVRRKLYLDGRLVGGSTVLNAVTLAGANRFRVAANPDGSGPLAGQVDGAFVCGYALTASDIAKLYAKGGQDPGASPKNAGDHIERLDSTSVLTIFDTLPSSYTVDLGVGG